MADGSFPVDYHSYIQRKRELKKQSTESRIAVFDEDDSRMYYEPEAVSVCDSDLDMPF